MGEVKIILGIFFVIPNVQTKESNLYIKHPFVLQSTILFHSFFRLGQSFLMFSGSICAVFSLPSGQMSCETEHRSLLACPQKYISPTLISAMKKRQIQSQVSWPVCEVFCSSNCYLMPHIMFYVKSPQNEPVLEHYGPVLLVKHNSCLVKQKFLLLLLHLSHAHPHICLDFGKHSTGECVLRNFKLKTKANLRNIEAHEF